MKNKKQTNQIEYLKYLVQAQMLELAISKKRLQTLSKISNLSPEKKEYLGWYIKIAEYELKLVKQTYDAAKKEE